MKIEIEDTYAEAFDGLFFRVLITANKLEVVKRICKKAVATPSIVVGRIEAGIERWVNKGDTPDGRFGGILQFWGALNKKIPNMGIEKIYKEFSIRIRQNILVEPFTSVFDFCRNPIGTVDAMKRIGHCGDGYEWMEKRHGRDMIIVPLMVPDFKIEHYLGYGRGIIGGNFWYMCKNKRAVIEAGKKALKAIDQIENVITPFGVCSAGSKAETKYKQIGPTTNHLYCPTLKKKLGSKSKVPIGIKYIPEIVINGTTLDFVKKAIKVGIKAVSTVKGVNVISAGNYGGKLGEHKIFIKEVIQ
jgi:formylmethanofuran--tetrahydromethanopterin N-formyltransferase